MFHKLPLCTAHTRMRMRPSRLYLTVITHVVVMTALAIVLRFVDYDWFTSCTVACLAIQYLCLAVGGCNAIGYGISQEIKSGLLSFHRLTPMSADAILLGYVFGMTSTVYLAGCLWGVAGLLFCLPSLILPWQYLAISGIIVLSSFYFHLVAALSTLIVPSRLETKHRASSPSILLPLCFPFVPVDTIFLTPVPLIFQLFTPANMNPEIRDWLLRVAFGTISLPAAFYSLLLLAVFGGLTYCVARYKIAFENRPAFSKKHAILIALTLSAIIIARTMQYMQRPDMARTLFFLVLLALSFITLGFVIGIIPKRLLIRQHCVRIVEENRRDPWGHDAAPALPAAIVLVAICVAAQHLVYLQLKLPPGMQQNAWHALLVHNGLLAGLAICLVGLGEGCRLRFAKDANNVIAVILAIWWLFPPILLTIDHDTFGPILVGISPLAGFVATCIPVRQGALPPHVVETTSLVVTAFAALAAYVGRRQCRERLMRELRENSTTQAVPVRD